MRYFQDAELAEVRTLREASHLLREHMDGEDAGLHAERALFGAHFTMQGLGARLPLAAVGMFVTAGPCGTRPMPRPVIDGMGIVVP